MSTEIRPAAVAGTFYPADRTELESLLGSCFETDSVSENKGKIFALVSPHAGLVYSGKVAGEGYRLLKNQDITNIIILAPSHFEYYEGGTVYDGSAYSTPLGEITINSELSNELVEGSAQLKFSSLGHGREHSLEVQLPFLQTVLNNDFEIVPIVIGDIDMAMASDIASVISDSVNRLNSDVLIIASTDLSHFHEQEEANLLDKRTAGFIENLSINELYGACKSGKCEACGVNPLLIVMEAAKLQGALSVEILKYATSGDVIGDYSSVVGYLSAVIRA